MARRGSQPLAGVSPALAQAAMAIINASGGRIGISSGYRDPAHQQRLWQQALAKYGDPEVADNWVARPGTSMHERGMAIDFSGDMALLAQLAPKYGLYQPMEWEPWHYQLGEGSAGVNQNTPGGIAYNLQFEDGTQAQNPEDVLASRLQAVMQIIGSDPYMPPGVDLSQMQGPTDSTSGEVSVPSPVDLGSGAGNEALLNQFEGMTGGFEQFQPSQAGPMPSGGGKPEDPNGYGNYAQQLLASKGINSPQEYAALVALWNRESGDPAAGSSKVTWNPLADNPYSTAFGIAQFLNGTWGPYGPKTANPFKQMDYGVDYIIKRYGSPSKALAFHDRMNWY